MKTIRNLIAATLVAGSCISSVAGTMTGTVTGLYSLPAGKVLVEVSAAPTGSPACATGGNRFALDTATQEGKTHLSNVQLASALGKTLTIAGTNTCSVWTNSETVNDVRVVN